jgi:[acyl-carrier-protein] S-malonyltransferase
MKGGEVVPANYNAPGQLVISGDMPSVQAAMALAKENGAKKAVQLNVSGAFHSPLMMPAEAGLRVQLDGVAMKTPKFPVISNVTAQPVSDVVDARRLLIEQLTSPVRWTSCVRTMIDNGVSELIELGPGSVLTGLMKRIDKGAKARAVGKAEEVNAWQS